MPESTIDELDRADEAFAGNRLLSTFSARGARADRAASATMVELEPGEIVLDRGEDVECEPVSRSDRR